MPGNVQEKQASEKRKSNLLNQLQQIDSKNESKLPTKDNVFYFKHLSSGNILPIKKVVKK